jgi:hypothetical protein
MDKKQILDLVATKLEQGTITRAEVIAALDGVPTDVAVVNDSGASRVSLVLYAIGFVVVAVGLGMVISDNWHLLGTVGRLGVTLGIGIATFIGGFLYGPRGHTTLSQVLFLVSAALIPFGAIVAFDEIGYDPNKVILAAVAAAIACIYAVAFTQQRAPVPFAATIALASYAYYAMISFILSGDDLYDDGMRIAMIVAGIAYAFVGYTYNARRTGIVGAEMIRGIVLSAAVVSVLVPLFTYEANFVDGILFIAALSAMYFAVFARSGITLVVSSIFLVAAIIKVVGEYFFETFGIAMALVALGFVVMGIGYATVALYKQRISRA